ncbi:MAG: aspartate aminotransferase family protein [Candidatus Brocadia sp. AMX2]|uniref:alanine--glyoxylate transaminase n=1 Tax=Candidatus Brocadia sinica JPN1 TaxID=1197129 RepID=A0ABQ0JT74_9BACT|nr:MULTISPECIES: aspartate aminotransferase family protein [Brocadia]KXK31246.1 MAG: aminotransferase [Candidatus Brocadia sinica]MBC6932758.1 aspartate aminotransferase family protein [Candidatus Brocadia sp.]MBL1170100.1 aspartate aminotransferase family protein [Candidatus Brocadia sp. AMX1]NOG43505.1 aspartate aminotransferase family protein [Planctomycetota bacterium]KAA0244054.1 MAG: aspartate aminotransferase family protein [Candidatus Brocadia sp. AMX2]
MTTNHIGPDAILRKKLEYLIPCVYHFYKKPMQIIKGQMQYLYDHTGKQYLDFYGGVSVMNAGHCNPEVVEKICEQMRTLQHTTAIYLTQPMIDLAEKLALITPPSLKRSFFCASGSEANEGAALLAQLYTKKHKFVAVQQGLHGRTKLTMNLTGLPMWRTDPNPSGDIVHIPGAYCYRCAYGLTYPLCDLRCARYLEDVVKNGEFAAFIVEPIQGNGGIITPPSGYFQLIRKILDTYNMLFITDEVQTGFGRTGEMFAIEHWNVIPDIMTMAKALANGTPIGAFITNDKIALSYTRPGASTTGGNPVSATAALATMDVIERYQLVQRAKDLGNYFKDKLIELQQRHKLMGEVRGKGLMLGVELVKENKIPAAEETDNILEDFKDRGILAGKTGVSRNVLTFQPPLVITREDIDRVIEALDEILFD